MRKQKSQTSASPIRYNTKYICTKLSAFYAAYSLVPSSWLWHTYVKVPQLRQNYEQLKLPPTLKQTSVTYWEGSVDVQAAWIYTYQATGTRRTIYRDLTAALQQAGYENMDHFSSPSAMPKETITSAPF